MARLICIAALAFPLVAGEAALRIDEHAFTARFGAPERYTTDVRMPFVVTAASLVVVFFWRRLRQAEQRASDALLVKARILASLSHELQTPMNGILGSIDLLLDTRLDVEQRESIESIRKSAGDLQSSIRDLLDLSSMRQGLMVASPIRTDLLALCEEVTAMIAPAAAEKSLEIGLCFDADVPRFAECDAAKVRQILIHLMANAVKFTARGSVSADVTRREGMLQIAVKDTGPGITRGAQKELFAEFVSGDDSAARAHRGLGLGLALCRQWAEMLGGELGLRSVVGEGSTFWLAVPVAFDGALEARPLVGRRALVIDDGSAAVVGLTQALARMGVAATHCGSAALGLKAAREAAIAASPFDYVFLDDGRGTLDRDTLKTALKRDARSARAEVLPLAFARFDLLQALLADEHLSPHQPGEHDIGESLAALMAATSPAATPYPKTDTRSALIA